MSFNQKNSKRIVIISPCPPRTGSTFLYNAICGFIKPNDKTLATDNPSDILAEIENLPIVKTHMLDINKWQQWADDNNINIFFISIYRPKLKRTLPQKYSSWNNFINFNYEDILETENYSLTDIVDFLYKKIRQLLPSEILMDKDSCLNRLINMNKMVEKMKTLPFSEYEEFYHIHGSHRNRGR